MGETASLAQIHSAVMDRLRNRTDAALFGAQAVNAYLDDARATQDVDILSLHAGELAEEIRHHLNATLHVAVRVREVREGVGFRVVQIRKPVNRHLVDICPILVLPPTQRVAEVLVLTLVELLATKAIAYSRRQGTARSFTDHRDIALLLLKFPDLKTEAGEVRDRLVAIGADEKILETWGTLVAEEIRAQDDEDGY